ncbi:MAG: hypothetical protein DHS80DRAFT_16610 [Piptocephalis tieghemiana]|nr:MAG: hypothetical protein DHS80DRAFT_16610 [Piptocephalis tieghemiana]
MGGPNLSRVASHLANGLVDAATDLNDRLSNWFHTAFPSTHTPQTPSSLEILDLPEEEWEEADAERSGGSSQEAEGGDRVCWVLGTSYRGFGWDGPLPRRLQRDLLSRIHCTYRTSFPPLGEQELTSDVGWGCMMRTGQSLLAQALLLRHLGRGWRIGRSVNGRKKDAEEDQLHRRILSWFVDTPEAPFSLHAIAQQGQEAHGKRIGEWHGPNTLAMVLRDLAGRFPECGLRIAVALGDTIYKDQVRQVATDSGAQDEWQPLLLLVVVMLGVGTINPVYLPALRVSLTFPQSVGVAGGRPDASLYFVGFEGEDMLYLDPHRSKPSFPPKSSVQGVMSDEEMVSYHGDEIRRISGAKLDPCALLGFYLEDEASFRRLSRQLEEIRHRGGMPMCTVEESTPQYAGTPDFGSVSDGEFDLE